MSDFPLPALNPYRPFFPSLADLFHMHKVLIDAFLENVVVVRSFDFQQGFIGRGAGVEQGPTFREGDDMVELGMDDQTGVGEQLYFIHILQSRLRMKADAFGVDSQYSQQRRKPGESAFDDQAFELLGSGAAKLDGRSAAQRPTHYRQGAGVAIVFPVGQSIVQNPMAVRHHGCHGGRTV